MKEGRIEGRVVGTNYVIATASGAVKEIPIAQAREDPKLAAAIKRNGWEPVDGGQ